MATKRILVIESEDDFAQSLVSAFSNFDAEVSVIADGKQGLQAAKTDLPDLILLRVELPRMSGYSICNKLKKDKNLKDVPLVIMSSEATDETFEQHRKLKTRAEDYIIQPFEPQELISKVSALVQLDSTGGGEVDEIITLDDDEAISLDDEEAITLDDDEAFSIDELADLDDGDEELDLGDSDSTVVMESPLGAGEAEGLENFDDVFDDLQVAPEAKPAPAALAEEDDELSDDLADFDNMLESLNDADDDEAGPASTEEEDELDLTALEDLELPEDDELEAAPAADEASADELLDGLVMEEPALGPADDGADLADAAPAEPVVAGALLEGLSLDGFEVGRDETPVAAKPTFRPEPKVPSAPQPVSAPAGPDPVLVMKLQNTEEENRILREQVAKLEARIEEMHQSFEKRDSELGSLRSRTTSKDKEFLALKSTINTKDREILEHKEEINHKDQEILEVQEKIADRAAEIARLQETLAGRDREIKDQAAQLDSLRQQKNEIEELHAAKMAEWEERYTQETAQLEHRILTVAEEHESALKAADERVGQAHDKLARVQSEMENTIQRHNDEVFGLRARSKQERERLDSELKTVRTELDSTREQYARECADHTATKEAAALVPELQTDLEQTRDRIEELEQQVAELMEAIAEHEERVVQAYQKIKNDEKLKQKARKAVEIAFTLLADEVSADGDGESDSGDEAHT